MSDLMKSVNKMCLPAQLYLAISTLSLIALLFQNIGQKNVYCIGHLQTQLPCNNMTVFIFKILYIIVFTWLLQKFCAKGYKTISWLLVLLPFILMFLLLLIMIFSFN